MSRSVRSRLAAASGAILLATLVAGCAAGSQPADGSATGGASPTGAADAVEAGDWTPVTVSGLFGDTEIVDRPERVLALDPTDSDFVLALGVEPVAIASSAQTDAATGGDGMWAWQEDLFGADAEKIAVEPDDVNVEAIAALQPDLIVATAFFGLTQDVYDRLSEIAPVVHFDTEANADAWEDSTRKVALALGDEQAADDAIARADDVLQQAAAEHPELDGTVYNAVISPTPDTLSILCSDTDDLARVLGSLGMTVSAYATSIDCAGGKQPISWENLGQLDADFIWAIPDDADQMDELGTNAVWNALGAVADGHVIVTPKTDGVPAALAFPSPLSIQWAADQIIPRIAEATGA